MSERPEWMPSAAIAGETMKEYTYDSHERTVSLLCYCTGLRAQVAVLEELVSESRSEPCLSALITHKIITLRKEIDG